MTPFDYQQNNQNWWERWWLIIQPHYYSDHVLSAQSDFCSETIDMYGWNQWVKHVKACGSSLQNKSPFFLIG